MHGNRRRKKRPSYGVRTVEITKGHNGFGFTISGQAPCILSCIVPVSPAERAGLRPGDYLIAVNGQNVSKVPHDDVVRLIGQSKLLKLQIAENYYSDSSDDELNVNRPKPKYPNRLRHKHQQTRAEKVVRDLQSGAIFSEHAAIHNSENAPLSDRDWGDPYSHVDSFIPTSNANSTVNVSSSGSIPNPPLASTSPTRLRPDQISLVLAEARQVPRISRPKRDEAPMHPPRPRPFVKPRDKLMEGGKLIAKLPQPLMNRQPLSENLQQSQSQFEQEQQMHHDDQSQCQLQTSQEFHLPASRQNILGNQQHFSHKSKFQYQHQHLHNRHLHKLFEKSISPQTVIQSPPRQRLKENISLSLPSPSPKTVQHRQALMYESNLINSQYSHQSLPQSSQFLRQQYLKRQINNQIIPKIHQSEFIHNQLANSNLTDSPCNGISEQDINNILYPTLAEIQQNNRPPENMGQVVYRSVVGYLGTIEMPKEPQGGSRLTAIRNCIRRLRIEKKVHTLVLMSVFSECVVLTNPHGLTLAEYPADRITFCGVYADDKKFFGLITVHGNSVYELSDVSQDEGNDMSVVVSSSCHVFMVDPNAINHPEHCRRAKNFRLECTPGPLLEDGSSYCMEFPESADPILHSIMSLYRNRAGFNLDNSGAPGLVDVDAQMSPQHSNTSSNSSNSDSGIGFRDEGNHQYQNSERVLVVEFDENQGSRHQNVQVMGSLRINVSNSPHLSLERAQINTIRSHSSNIAGETSDSSVPSMNARNEDKIMGVANKMYANSNNRTNSRERPPKCNKSHRNRIQMQNKLENRLLGNGNQDTDANLRANVSDINKLKELRTTLSEGRMALHDGCSNVMDDLSFVDNDNINDKTLTPGRSCTSPMDCDRLTVRAMPDPVNFERSPGCIVTQESPAQVSSIRHSMHKYLQHKQEHLVKVSQKINRRDSDSGTASHLMNVRAFSPASGMRTPSLGQGNKIGCITQVDLSLKLSPKVFGVPFKSSAPSEHSFTRSLEDIRDSSTSDEKSGCLPAGATAGTFKDGSESDNGLSRLIHGSENNLSRCCANEPYIQDIHRGAFRAVRPRSRRPNPIGLPTVGNLPDMAHLSGIPCLSRPLDSWDENTETTENTGGQGGSQDVYPPTQDEFSHDSDFDQVESNDGKQPRGVSLRRLARSRQGHDTGATSDSNATQSDHEFKLPGPIIRVGNGLAHSEPSLGSSRIGSWATSFEKLLEDPAGLHTFAEFLKKEYSHENIYFWTACERYKYVEDDEHRKELAKNIFKRHLGLSASEPVNVDSHARQLAQDGLSNPDEFLFVAAQKQIFNLMKFDSYSRFLKSELYNTCLSQERKGLPLPYPGGEALDSDLWILENQFSKELKKSKSDTDDRRRKSLLPWHRKDRSKSKDRSESDLRRGKKSGRTVSESSSARYDLSDSRTSLSSSDRAMSKESLTSGEAVSLSGSDGLSLCRFVLPDQSNSVLAVRPGESIKDLVRQLLERRRINFTDFNVVLTKGNKPVDLNKDSTVLGGLEARVERMVLFSLHLPSRKTVIVKAKPHKLASDVLKPILSKYGLKLDLMFIYKSGDASGINVKDLVTELDGQKLIVQTKEEIKEWTDPARQPRSSSSLDEITNRVFEDLLNGKTKSNFDDLGVLDFDSRSTKTEPTSETSSSLLGNINRRESLSLERSLPSRHSEGGRALISDHSFGSKRKENKDHSNFNAKTKQENADLYEGLKRAQLFRLDDQRGTEINFELPDFLKADQSQGAATTLLSHFDRSFDFISSDATDRSEFLSRAHPEVWGGVQDTEGADTTLTAPADLDLDDFEETLRSNKENQVNSDVNIIKNNLTINNNNKFFSNNNNNKKFAPSQSPYLTPPPPLPPKPKFGAALRGPPPRPPSRQLTSLSRSVQLLDMPLQMRSSNQSLTDKFSVSFV